MQIAMTRSLLFYYFSLYFAVVQPNIGLVSHVGLGRGKMEIRTYILFIIVSLGLMYELYKTCKVQYCGCLTSEDVFQTIQGLSRSVTLPTDRDPHTRLHAHTHQATWEWDTCHTVHQ